MKTLADEIFDLIPAHPEGLTIARAVELLAVDAAHVRKAFYALNETQRARLRKRPQSRELFFHPSKWIDYRDHNAPFVCEACRAPFGPPKHPRRCCCRSCAVSLSWRDPNVHAARCAAIGVERRTPEALARTARLNAKRWSDPAEHEKLSEHNRRQWQDPQQRASRSRGIRAAHGTPEKRKFYSDFRRAAWADPEQRRKMQEAAAESQRKTNYRKLMGDKLRERWKDPAYRALMIERSKAAKRAKSGAFLPKGEQSAEACP
jgi:hypothetical protein